MKQNKSSYPTKLGTQETKTESKLKITSEEMNAMNTSWFMCACYNPFISIIALPIAFDELKTIFKNWISKQKKGN